VSGIVDQNQATGFRQGPEGRPVAWLPGNVNSDDGSSPRRNCPFHGSGINRQVRRIDVDKNRPGAKVTDDLGRRRERVSWDDHLVLVSQVDGNQGKVEGGSPGVEGDTVGHPDVR
jgi:hypothetical protein